ncbi:MAG: hypothetical protein IT384_27255 [Deltaproteobacteria bacterium]|nr:hypothetical protein [Deltaproteobacteria bacterium]
MTEQRRSFGRPIEVVRAELIASEEARSIAKTFGISVEEYAALVLDYAQNPDKVPEIQTIEADPEGEQEGPSYEEVHALLARIERGELGARSEGSRDAYAPAGVETERATGAERKREAPKVGEPLGQITGEGPLGSVLEAEVRAQRAAALSHPRPPAIGTQLKPKPGR